MSQLILYFQVVAAAAFTPAGEKELGLEKGAKDFFKEELVENLNRARATVVLEVVVVRVMVTEVVEVVEEGTPGEAVGVINLIPVEEEEVPTMLEKIRKVIAVIIQLVMAM